MPNKGGLARQKYLEYYGLTGFVRGMLAMVVTKALVGGGDALTGHRVKLLRMTLGYPESKMFADHLGIGRQRWNAFETGKPLSKEVAFLLRERTGVTLDWLWFGEMKGLPDYLVDRLTRFPPIPRADPVKAGRANRKPRRGRHRSLP